MGHVICSKCRLEVWIWGAGESDKDEICGDCRRLH